MKLKVCGLREPQHIEQICQMNVSYLGFHFHKASPDFIGDRISFDFVRSIPKHIRKAGVFADQDSYSVLSAVARYDLDLVQLQGDECPAVCLELKPYVKIAKAFKLTEHFNFEILERYIPHVDYFLFDGRDRNDSSTDGILQQYPHHIPFFLSGFISQISPLPQYRQLFALDLNMGSGAGLNDLAAVRELTGQLRQT